ncbi:MAG: DUF4831 family protein [Bacteroidales bacterium]
MKKWILSLLSLAAISAFAQEATKITAGKHNDFGLAYSLPLTVVEVEIEATKITTKTGPYYKYAEKYLGVQEIVTEDLEYWEMNDVTMAATSIADPEKSYLVKFKSGNPPSMYLTPEGVLWSVNIEPPVEESVTERTKGEKAPAGTNPYYSVLSEEQLSAGSTAKMAEVAAKQIYRIRESRLNLVTGDVDQLPADGKSFELIMNQLNEQETALTEMFLGTTKKTKVRKTVRYVPGAESERVVLFRFSKYMGVVGTEDLGGAPVYLNYKITENLTQQDSDEKKKDKNKGVAYIVPGKGVVSLVSGTKTLAEQEIQIAQLGETYQFPTNLFDDKKAPAKAILNPISGAVQEVVQ